MIAKSVLNTAPASLAVPLATVKQYLRIDGTSEDTEVTSLINASTQRLEKLSDRKFVSQKWDIYFDSFPYFHKKDWWDGVRDGAMSELYSPQSKIELPFGPLISVQSFETYDDDDVAYLFASSNYNVDTASPFGVVALKIGSVWPQTVLRSINGIKIAATFGYAAVPEDIAQAIQILVAAMYENRGDEIPKIPGQCGLLIEPYRRLKINGC